MQSLKVFLFLLLFVSNKTQAQSIVHGGFLSFILEDSNSSNGGGAILFSDTQSDCLTFQSGSVFGKSDLFNVSGHFKENCYEQNQFTNFKLYPNPNLGQFYIEGHELSNYIITDNTGRIIKQKLLTSVPKMKIEIDLFEESEGTYFIKILNSKNQECIYPIIKLNP